MKSTPVSVVILARNEAAHLKILLPTLDWAAEMIVVDDESSDETVAVAKRAGARVIRHALNNDYASARNVGLTEAREKWVLFVDADERVPKALVEEIRRVVGLPQANNGYLIKREDVLFGKKLRHGEVGHMWLLRLGRKDAGVWERSVHEVWNVADVGRLTQPIHHYSHPTLQQFFKVVTRYAQLEAAHRKDTPWSGWDMVVYPLGKFLYAFLWQWGFLDGWRGLLMSVMMSYHSFLVRWNMATASFVSGYRRSMWVSLVRAGVVVVWIGAILGQLLRVQIVSGAAIYLFEPVMMIVVLLWMLKTHPKRFPAPWLLLMGVLGATLLINKGFDVGVAGLYWGRLLLYGLFALAQIDMTKRGWIRWSWTSLLGLVGLGLALFGLVQYVVWPDTRFLFYLGWDDHYYRLIGTWFDPGFMGLALGLALVLLEKRLRGLTWITFGLIFTAMMLTYARSAWLAYVVAIGVLALRRKSWRMIITRWGLVALALFLLPHPGGEGVNLARTYSVVSRVSSSTNALTVFREHPIFGVGFNAYSEAVGGRAGSDLQLPSHANAPDNSWLLLLATTGVVGMLAVFYSMYWGWRFVWRDEVVWVSLVMIGLHALTNNSLFYPLIMLWIGGLLATCYTSR